MADGTFLRFPRDNIRAVNGRASDPGGSDHHYDSREDDASAYDTRGHDARGYDPGKYDTPQYDAGGHDSPTYGSSGYDSHGYDSRGYGSSGADTHGYDTRGNDSRGYDSPRPDSYESDVRADRGGPASDPLAELARLIGRTDPFAVLPQRGSVSPRASDDGVGYGRAADDDYRSSRRDGFEHHDAEGHFDSSPRDFGPDDRFSGGQNSASRSSSAAVDHLDTGLDDELGDAVPIHGQAELSHPPYRDHLPPLEQRAPLASDTFLASEEEAARHAPHFDPPDHSTDFEHVAADASRHGEYDYGPAAADEADEYPYDEDAAPKRRYSVKVVAAVLGLAVFGTAGAFGYRSVFKGGHHGPPPVIHADNTPTKIVPSATSGDSSAKPINERLGDGSQERMVKREEVPVPLPSAAVPLAAPSPPAAAPVPPPVAAPAATLPNPPAASAGTTSEPKRVRTVSIRADQALSGAPATRPVTRTAAIAPTGASSPAGSAPLSLTPEAVNAAAGVVGSTDAVHPRARGSFVVQVSAQKSESEAEASFHAMQARYAILSGRQPLIRRKDQGERGVFYVAQVGPFGTRDEASQMCESLKSAGGSCFVQKN